MNELKEHTNDNIKQLDLTAAMAQKDARITRLAKALEEIRNWGGDCECVRRVCPRCVAHEALEKEKQG